MRSPLIRFPRRRTLHLEELEPRLVLSGTQPTAVEQQFLELLNDARANPAAYGASIGVDLSYIAPSAPLAWDTRLVQAALGHSQDMNAQGFFAHTNPFTGLDPGGRIANAGYPYTTWGESIAAGSIMPTPADALKTLIVDAGVPSLGHRNQLLDYGSAYQLQTQVGIGIVQNGAGQYTNYYTIDSAGNNDTRPFLTGVVFNDANGNGKYDIGEGLSGVTITVAGIGTTTTFASGGYSFQLSPGGYAVTASGGGLSAPLGTTVQVGAANARVNLTPQSAGATPAQMSAWVGLLYRDILQRTASAGEIAGWVNGLQLGLSRPAVVAAFLGSLEHDRDLVNQIYQQYLHRSPDAGGLAGWVSTMQAGVTEVTVRQAILGSPEYAAAHGSTDAGFVQGLYSDVLGRAPLGNEASGWTALAASGNRAAVIAGFMHSWEFDSDIVSGLYQTYLRRTVDTSGLSFFTGYVQSSHDPYFGLEILLVSGEYFNGAQSW